LYLKCL
jgi:hypothetical protein